MTERPILFSLTTGKPSKRGQKIGDGLTWKQRNRDAVNARRRELYASDPDKHRARQRAYRVAARDQVNSYNKAWSADYRAGLRSEMLESYGSRCNCCGEREPLFLQLDHIENDGHADRKIHRTSTKLLAHLKRAGWPKDRHQLLCANCNFGKLMNGGVCPHAKDQS